MQQELQAFEPHAVRHASAVVSGIGFGAGDVSERDALAFDDGRGDLRKRGESG